MPFCTQCGKWLNDGETCTCRTASGGQFNNQNGAAPPPYNGQPYNNGQPSAPTPYPNQPYGQYPYYNPQQPPPKKSNAWILAIIIPVVCFILLILAAILVPAYLGYTKKSRQVQINSEANTLYKAANTALVELDEEGENLKGIYVITSDPEMNRKMMYSFDLDDFRERIDKYFPAAEDYKYFMIIKDGCVQYSAISKQWKSTSTPVGTWPGSSLNPRKYSASGYSKESPTKCDLYTLYVDALKELGNGDL